MHNLTSFLRMSPSPPNIITATKLCFQPNDLIPDILRTNIVPVHYTSLYDLDLLRSSQYFSYSYYRKEDNLGSNHWHTYWHLRLSASGHLGARIDHNYISREPTMRHGFDPPFQTVGTSFMGKPESTSFSGYIMVRTSKPEMALMKVMITISLRRLDSNYITYYYVCVYSY